THTGLTNGTAYFYRACAVDTLGNMSSGTTASATPQAGAPTAGAVTPANTQFGSFVSSPFDLSTSFSSALTACEYTTDGATWVAATVSGSTCSKTGIPGSNGQSVTLNMRGASGGAWGTGTAVTRTVDTTAPTTTSNAPAAWVGTDQTVALAPGDGSGSGVASTQYCTDTTNTCAPGTSGTSVSVTCGSGSTCQTYVRYQSRDNLGNVELTKSALVRIDKATPTNGTLAATPGNAQVALSWSGTTDTGSGLNTAPYKLVYSTGSLPASCASGTTLLSASSNTSWTHTSLTNGVTYYYRLCASDGAGNMSSGATASAAPQGGQVSSVPELVGFIPAVASAMDVVVDGTAGRAYVASQEFGLSVVNVSNPLVPVAIGGANPSFYGGRLAVSGSLGVVGGRNNANLHVVDLSVPTTPITVGALPGSFTGAAVAGRYAYAMQLIPGNPARTDLLVLDLINPSAPTVAGSVTLAGGEDITLVGSYLYVAAGMAGLQVVN